MVRGGGRPVVPGKSSAVLWLLCLALGLAAALALWLSTPTYGLAMTPDSTVYLGAAQSMLKGKGLSNRGVPLTHFPPAYPIALAAAARLLHTGPFTAARYLHVLLFACNLVLAALLAYLCSGGSGSATVAGMLLLGVSAQTLRSHLNVASEPLFLAFTLTSLVLAGQYLLRRRSGWLLAAALAGGLAITTRYVGVALLLPLLWVAWRYTPQNRRVRTTVLALACSAAPAAAWVARNVALRLPATNRTLAYHPVDLERLREFQAALSELILPGLSLPGLVQTLLTVGGLALALGSIAFWLRKARTEPPRARAAPPAVELIAVLLILALSYVGVLLLSLTFLDASIMGGRFVLIPYTMVGMAALAAVYQLTGKGRSALWWGVLLCLALSLVRNGQEGLRWAQELRAVGHGYSGQAWAESPTVAAVRSLPSGLVLYSNVAEAIQYVTGRETEYLPRLYDPTSLIANPVYEQELDRVCRECREGRAVVVYLYQVQGRWQYGTKEELLSLCPLDYLGQWSDGALWGKAR